MSERTPRPHFEFSGSRAAEVVARLHANQEADLREIVEAANDMPELSSSVLRAANASTNGLQRSITSPEHAIAILGSQRIKEIVQELLQQNQLLRSATRQMLTHDDLTPKQ